MKQIVVFYLMIAFSGSAFSQTRKRLDLDELMIKGQLLGDDRIVILSRQRNELKNYVKFRTSYKEEMLQELSLPKLKRNF
jgi:hypothetical protein